MPDQPFDPSEVVKKTDSNELLAASLNNQSLAQYLREIAGKDYTMGSLHFFLLTEAANRIGSQS